jgi:hypothetical protein
MPDPVNKEPLPRRLSWGWLNGLTALLSSEVLSTDRFLCFRKWGVRTVTRTELGKLLDGPIGLALNFLYDADPNTAVGVTASQLRLDNDVLASATNMYVSETALNSVAAGAFLSTIVKGSRVVLRKDGNPNVFGIFVAGTPVDNGSDRTIPLTLVLSAGEFADGDHVILSSHGVPVPAIPGAGTFKLQSVNQTLQWTADA